MTSIYEVQQLLKRFGTIIYTGDRIADLELMQDEVRELYRSQLVEQQQYLMAMLLLKHEIQTLRDKLQ